MPRVHYVKSARKDNPVAQKGESYYWWKFRFGGKRYSKTYPKRSQLTQSAYFGALYDLCEVIEDYEIEPGEASDVENMRDEIESELNNLLDECQSSLDNMPESLQYSPTGELLQERIDALENAINEVGYIEEPEQWQDVRDQEEEHEEWLERKPENFTFVNERKTKAEFEEALEEWEDEEPEIDDFDEFDKFEISAHVEECII